MNTPESRFPKAVVSAFNLNLVQTRNPYVVLWWSAAIPGFGHIMLGKYIQGFILVAWELATNQMSHLNLSIYYSMIGDIDSAKEVLRSDWLLLYIAVYVFTMWDSYRRTFIMNKVHVLSERNLPHYPIMKMNALGTHVLYHYNPLFALISSVLLPGLGHLYLHQLVTGGFLLISAVFICMYSNVLRAIHYTFLGDFSLARSVLNPQWLLFFPSAYCFAMYDSYHETRTMNQMIMKEQVHYLQSHYPTEQYKHRSVSGENGVEPVYTAASYKCGLDLELLLTHLEHSGIQKEHLLVLPLISPGVKKRLPKSFHLDREHVLDLAFPFGTVFMLFGVIYGFVLPLGPIFMGLFGLLFGVLLGYIFGVFLTKKKPNQRIIPEIVVVVQCEGKERKAIDEILLQYAPTRVFSV